MFLSPVQHITRERGQIVMVLDKKSREVGLIRSGEEAVDKFGIHKSSGYQAGIGAWRNEIMCVSLISI